MYRKLPTSRSWVAVLMSVLSLLDTSFHRAGQDSHAASSLHLQDQALHTQQTLPTLVMHAGTAIPRPQGSPRPHAPFHLPPPPLCLSSIEPVASTCLHPALRLAPAPSCLSTGVPSLAPGISPWSVTSCQVKDPPKPCTGLSMFSALHVIIICRVLSA